MPVKSAEKSEMSSVECFAQGALQDYIAPRSLGSRKERLRKCAHVLGWTHNRVKDVWDADPRITIKGRELVKIEEVTGLRYGRQELTEIDRLVSRADALLEGSDPDFYRAWVDAFRTFVGAQNRARNQE